MLKLSGHCCLEIRHPLKKVCAVRVVARFRPPVTDEERKEELAPLMPISYKWWLTCHASFEENPVFTVDSEGVGISYGIFQKHA